jgi:hypothetical protein
MGTYYTTWTETTIEERREIVNTLYKMGVRQRADLQTAQGQVSIPGSVLIGSIIIIEEQVQQ